MPPAVHRDRFLALVHEAVSSGTLVKLTLGKYRGTDATLKNVFIRPVELKSGPHLAFLWRHATRDIAKNFSPVEALGQIERLIGGDFLDAHLFTMTQKAQFESEAGGSARLKITASTSPTPAQAPSAHDERKQYLIPASAPWLRALGITNDRALPREGMADKFRQIQKFAELLTHLIAEAFPAPAGGAPDATARLRVADMGSGKGYLTFALAHVLGDRADVHGIEARHELVELCNRISAEHGFAPHLHFSAGRIADTPAGSCDILIALHACDTATDDALASGIAAGARLLVVAPCCQKELRPQLAAPPVLADALRHGIFRERQAEFVTDALRAQLLEWAGYRTRVFEFISTEHTAKNLMIAAIKAQQDDKPAATDSIARRAREFAAFYGIRRQQLASALEFPLEK